MTRRMTLFATLGTILVAVSVWFGPALLEAAPTYIDRLQRPKVIQGGLRLSNNELVRNLTDDMVEFIGVAGTDDTDLRIDLDGTHPVLSSPTDATIELAEAVTLGGAITLENGETIDNATDDFIEWQGGAGADDTDLRLDLDGTHPIFNSPTDAQIAFAEATIGLGTNGETLVMSADDAFDFTREDAGAVTLTCSDDDATCAMIYDAGGASTITLGSGDVTNVSVDSDVGLTFTENSDSLNNLADAAFDFTRNDAGAVTLTCSDDDAVCAMIYDAGGAEAITIGSADVTNVTVNSDVGLTFANNSDSLNNLVDAVFDFTRNDAGTVTLTCSDDDAVCAMIYDAGGAAAIQVGSADVTVITLQTDDTGDGTDLVLPAQSVNGSEILNDTITATQIADSACTGMHSITFNPTEAGATNDLVSLSAIDLATGDASFSATEGDEDQWMVSLASVANSLRVDVDAAPGVGNDDWKVTLRAAGGSTALTCAIDEAATTCTDVANTPTLAVGNRLAFLVDSSGGGADPDAAGEMTISFCTGP